MIKEKRLVTRKKHNQPLVLYNLYICPKEEIENEIKTYRFVDEFEIEKCVSFKCFVHIPIGITAKRALSLRVKISPLWRVSVRLAGKNLLFLGFLC